MNKEIDIPKEEIENPIKEIESHEDDGSLLKKKTKKVKDPNAPKKILTEGQKRALTLMNDARTKKKEEKLKNEYEKIMEKEKLKQSQLIEDIQSSSSEEEVIVKKSKTKNNVSTVIKKKKKKIIVIEESSDESSEEEEEPEIIYKSREMKSQQNRRSIIQQHNEKQSQKNFFCN